MANSSTRKPNQGEIEAFFLDAPASSFSVPSPAEALPSSSNDPMQDLKMAQFYLNRFLEREDKR